MHCSAEQRGHCARLRARTVAEVFPHVAAVRRVPLLVCCIIIYERSVCECKWLDATGARNVGVRRALFAVRFMKARIPHLMLASLTPSHRRALLA